MDSIFKSLSLRWVPHEDGHVLQVSEKCRIAYVGLKGLTQKIENAAVIGNGSTQQSTENIFDSPLDFSFDA